MSSAEMLDVGPVDVDEFALWWSVYPRHKDRRRAEGAYTRARKLATADEILTATRDYAASAAGRPAEQIRWAIEFLRAEPWKPETPAITPRPAPRKRRRRDPSKPRLSVTTRVRPTAAEQRLEWIRSHGLTEAEYEANKSDREWLALVERRGIVS